MPRRSLRLRIVGSALRRLSLCASFIEDEIAGLDAVVRRGDVCIDIGAEYGLYTFALADLVGPSGTVYGIEPLPGPAGFLKAGSRGTGGHRNIRLFQHALGREPGGGMMSLPVRRGMPVHGRAFLTTGARGRGPNAEFRGERRIRTAVTTLDAFCTEQGIGRIDFLKIDVEGAEAAVIDGGARILAASRPALLVEIEDRHAAKYGTNAAEVAARLRGLGYRMCVWNGRQWRAVHEVGSGGHRNHLFIADRRT